MIASSPEFEQWNRQLAVVVMQVGEESFFKSLVNTLNDQLVIDHPQVWLYRRGQPPVALFHNIVGGEREVQIDSYIEGSYQLDPFYQATINPQTDSGVYRLTEISATGFQQSDYYRSYYARLDTEDEIVYMVDVDEDTAIHLSLMRSHSSPHFSDENLAFLRAIEPMVRALVLQHGAKTLAEKGGFDNETLVVAPGFEQSVNRAFDLFGRSMLTGREKDVLGLVLQGYNTRTSAEKLGIATETLRRHRKNIYQKLDISSQTELFSLFLNSLSCFAQAPTEDPLSLYFNRPKNVQ